MQVQVNAQICNNNIPATSPNSRFINNGDGTVTDKETGLMWKRCSEGQVWDGATCTGTVTWYSYCWRCILQNIESMNAGVGYAGYTDWRLPNIKEYASIVEQQCAKPAINESIFPGTQWTTTGSGYWSSTPDVSSNYIWMMDYSYGKNHTYSYNGGVRLVRDAKQAKKLQIQNFGITIITHGWNSSGAEVEEDIGWATELARGIASQNGANLPVYYIRFKRTDDTLGLPRGEPIIDRDNSDILNISDIHRRMSGAVIVIDWSKADGALCWPFIETSLGYAPVKTGTIADEVFNYIFDDASLPYITELPIHLIGHSRGTSVISSLANRLAQEKGIWLEHVTSLDAHPFRACADSVNNDFIVATWENTLFADSYWRTNNNPLDFSGGHVFGAYNTDLSGIITGDGVVNLPSLVPRTFRVFPV